MDFKVDTGWLREYAGELTKRSDEVEAVHGALTEHQLEPEAFGELGASLGSPAAYQRAADTLLKQLEQADKVLTAAAESVGQVAGHYTDDDQSSAVAIEKRTTAGSESAL